MEIEKKENQEPEAEVPEVIFSDALPFQIVVNNKNRTYELVFDNEKASSVPGTFAMMILLREKFQNLLLQEKSNVALVSQGELNPKYVMSKTLYNKHLHAIELLSKYIKELAKGIRKDYHRPKTSDGSESLPIIENHDDVQPTTESEA